MPSDLGDLSDPSGDVDVLVVTVIEDTELPPLIESFGVGQDVTYLSDDQATTLRRGRLANGDLEISIALVCIHEQGNSSASAATAKAIERLHPTVAILVGIAAGRAAKLSMGDVVFGTAVLDYGVGRRQVDGTQPRFLTRSLARELPEAAMERACRQSLNQTDRELLEALTRALPNVDDLGVLPGDVPRVEPGIIASGTWVIADDLARQVNDRIIAAEMEGAGFELACRKAGVPWAIVRGVSDLGDSATKDSSANKDVFHGLAAVRAAVYARHAVRHLATPIVISRRTTGDVVVADAVSAATRTVASTSLHADFLGYDLGSLPVGTVIRVTASGGDVVKLLNDDQYNDWRSGLNPSVGTVATSDTTEVRVPKHGIWHVVAERDGKSLGSDSFVVSVSAAELAIEPAFLRSVDTPPGQYDFDIRLNASEDAADLRTELSETLATYGTAVLFSSTGGARLYVEIVSPEMLDDREFLGRLNTESVLVAHRVTKDQLGRAAPQATIWRSTANFTTAELAQALAALASPPSRLDEGRVDS